MNEQFVSVSYRSHVRLAVRGLIQFQQSSQAHFSSDFYPCLHILRSDLATSSFQDAERGKGQRLEEEVWASHLDEISLDSASRIGLQPNVQSTAHSSKVAKKSSHYSGRAYTQLKSQWKGLKSLGRGDGYQRTAATILSPFQGNLTSQLCQIMLVHSIIAYKYFF